MKSLFMAPKQLRAFQLLSRLKVHLRLLRLAGQTYRVVTLRPGTEAAFSTNYYHDTWHIVSDQACSRLLARLLWGLAFQRQPNTLFLVHGRHLRPTPFEAERSDPFLLIPSHLTPIHAEAFRQLKARLSSLGPPCGTIRWQSFGLDLARQREQYGYRYAYNGRDPVWYKDNEHLWKQERMGHCGGFIYYSAPPPILKIQAACLHNLWVKEGNMVNAMNYHFLAECRGSKWRWPDGEVQIFCDYRERVASAIEAREQMIPNPKQPVLDESLQYRISRSRDAIKRRRKWNRKSGP